MIFLLFPLSAAAGKGPYEGCVREEDWIWYPSYGRFAVANENGLPSEDRAGDSASAYFWRDGIESEALPNSIYDKETNTLTLNSLDAPDHVLDLYMMGEDFTVVVNGECSLAGVVCRGGDWGGSLTVGGKGILTVNEKKTVKSAFTFYPEDAPGFFFRLGEDVTVNMYAAEDGDPASVAADTEYDPKNIFDFANDSSPPAVSGRAKASFDILVNAIFADGPAVPLGILTERQGDPEGIYGSREVEVTYADGSKENYIRVERFVYSPTFETYFPDRAYSQKNGSDGVIRFESCDELISAGYRYVYTDDGEPAQSDITYPWLYSEAQKVYEYDDGGRYTFYDKFDEETGGMLPAIYEMKEIPELPGTFFCVPAADGIEPDRLVPASETRPASGFSVLIEGTSYYYGRTGFSDVPVNRWFSRSVLYCVRKGYISGVGGNRFDPGGRLTRAMFVQILARIANADLSGYDKSADTLPFKDVKAGKWYVKAVKWAFGNGYTSGVSSDRFGTDDPVTREQLASFLYTFSKKNGIDVSAAADITGYEDHAAISKWARVPLAWAVGSGLISGTSKTALSPKNPATRAQAALIIMNYVERIPRG